MLNISLSLSFITKDLRLEFWFDFVTIYILLLKLFLSEISIIMEFENQGTQLSLIFSPALKSFYLFKRLNKVGFGHIYFLVG